MKEIKEQFFRKSLEMWWGSESVECEFKKRNSELY
jgi:hypothetical protein